MKRALLLVSGFTCVALGGLGVVLPVLPTTPFLLVAAACFAKSSQRFHAWLLNSPLFGAIIQRWETERCIDPKVKRWAMFVVVVTFSFSIYVLDQQALRLFLLLMLTACLICISRLPVVPRGQANKSASMGG